MQLLSRIEAAEYLGVAPQTLANWANVGQPKLRFTKIGGLVKYLKEDLDAFILDSFIGKDDNHE